MYLSGQILALDSAVIKTQNMLCLIFSNIFICRFSQMEGFDYTLHLKFDMMLIMGCLLLATRLVTFWQHSGLHPFDIPVDFFPVYSISTLVTANQMNLCSNIPHLCTISILKRSTLLKYFHGSNRLTYSYIFVILCDNS